jgi:DNA mismatch repair ATPase MutS
LYQNSKIACACYDSDRKCLFYVFEVGESDKYELTSLLFDDLCPTTVLTSTRCPKKFVDFIKFNCKYSELDESNMRGQKPDKKKASANATATPNNKKARKRELDRNEDEEEEDDEDDEDEEDEEEKEDDEEEEEEKEEDNEDDEIGESCEDGDGDCSTDATSAKVNDLLSDYSKELCKAFEKRKNEIQFIQMAANDFSYELGKERILKINSLESMPDSLRAESDRFLYFSSFLNFDDTLMIRCIAGLLNYLDRYQSLIDIEFTNEINMTESNSQTGISSVGLFDAPIICSFRPLKLDKILLLDSNAFESLNIIHRTDLECPNRQRLLFMDNFRTILNEKRQTSTLYSFFMKKLCTKYGMQKLRSWFLKPSRDLTILEQRHSMVEFFMANENYELTNLLRSILKKCKYIRPIFNRMKVGSNFTFTHWKRLYNTTRAILKVCQICGMIAQKSRSTKTAFEETSQTEASQASQTEASQTSQTDTQEINVSFNESILYYKKQGNYYNPQGGVSFESFFDRRSKNTLTPPSKHLDNNKANNHAASTVSTDSKLTTFNVHANAALKLADVYSDKSSLLTRITDVNYALKFDYLANLFERTINVASSHEKNKCTVNENVSSMLDEKRRIYSKLPEYLTEMAAEELKKYDLTECNIMYMPQFGFLLVISEADLDQAADDKSDSPCRSSVEQWQAHFEHINELTLIFKSNKQYFYKNTKMKELDACFGDISGEINDLESNVIRMLQDEFLNYSHYYADMIDYCGELDVLMAFASIAKENDYVKPKFKKPNDSQNAPTTTTTTKLDSVERDSFICAYKVRHPMLEDNIESIFVPNDMHSSCKHDGNNDNIEANVLNECIVPKIKVITAPNASGKSRPLIFFS